MGTIPGVTEQAQEDLVNKAEQYNFQTEAASAGKPKQTLNSGKVREHFPPAFSTVPCVFIVA